MKAIKDNKVYTVNETTKKTYLNQGFDIYTEGKPVEKAPSSTVPYEQYAALQAENAELKAEIEKLKSVKK